MTTEPTVFIVDDDRAARNSLKKLVETVGIKVDAFESADNFLAEYDEDAHGCLVLDVRMPDASGLRLQEMLAKAGVSVPVIFITGFADVSTAVRALRGGAVDFIEKPYGKQHILDAIQNALRRDRETREAAVKRDEILARIDTLTKRERQIMDMIMEAKSSREVAEELRLSLKTVENHRSKMMGKMQAKNAVDLVRMVNHHLAHARSKPR